MNDIATNQAAEATRQQTASTLAAAIITASGRPWSVAQAIELQTDIYNSLFGGLLAGYGRYQEWKKTEKERVSKVHGPTD
jgi:hypothetical protein